MLERGQKLTDEAGVVWVVVEVVGRAGSTVLARLRPAGSPEPEPRGTTPSYPVPRDYGMR